jgi:F0F1-type ATP synthase assembly protein I
MVPSMVNKKKSPESSQEKKNQSLRDYARYSNLAFKWIAIILVGFFAGLKLDRVLKLEFPIFTLVLAMSGLFLSLYLLIKELGK